LRIVGNPGYRLYEAQVSHRSRHVLQGRERLLRELAPGPGNRVVELGAGRGDMIALWGARLPTLAALELVEAQPELVVDAQRRARSRHNVHVVAADIASYRPPWLADIVYFSYALTRIADWVRALNNALAILRPGGRLGVVDFYVSGGEQASHRVQHGALTRWFWTQWFGLEQLHVSDKHLAALFAITEHARLHEGVCSLPNLPLLKAPYYVFTGVKPELPRSNAMCELWKKSANKT
jgi:S-adenosylmethionine-diacylgycerolhomoserine-N-methlytransferase